VWLRALSRLPWGVLYGLSAGVAWLVHRVVRYRREIVRTNLTGCFPELDVRRRGRIEADYYRRLGELLTEVLKAVSLTREEIARRVTLHNVELLTGELAAGRSVLVVAAHHANWEWLLLGLSVGLGFPVDAAYKPLHGAGERLMRGIRTRFGSTLVPAKELLSRILRTREARALAMVADQEPVSSDFKWWTQFLGRPTAFYMGPEKIAQAARFAVVFAGMRRTARGHYRVEFQPIAAAREALDAGTITERYARLVEAQVRADPADWTWSHRRWKLRRAMYAAGARESA
jgi:KDO2-lipid IV(A) lauroyltransferase